jgi:dienelactone hydrolase
MKTVHALVFLFFLAAFAGANAQVYPVGNTTITFADPTRTGGVGTGGGPGRQIETKIFYPATAAGTNAPVANGTFGVLVFGHGFVMAWDSYAPIYDSLARAGFVVAVPRTEDGFSPNHTEFGRDLAFVSDRMLALNTNAGSIFNQKLNGKKAIGGHSMGGGSTILAGQYTTGINCMVTFAAANTNPSAITAAASVTVPNLVISGSLDCVAPPGQHQTPIYNALASSCKTFVSLTGGYHCQFNNYNFNCAFGESTCIPGGGLDRNTQLARTRSLMIPYLRYHIGGDCAAWPQFQNLITTANWLTYQNTCNPAFPAPVITPAGPVSVCAGAPLTLTAGGGTGFLWDNGATSADLTVSPTLPGTYTVTVSTPNGCTASTSRSVSILPEPVAAIAPLTPRCPGTAVTLMAAGGAAAYAWSNGATGFMQTVAPTETTVFTVTVTGANGCTSTASETQTVFAPPIATIGGPGTICLGGTATLTATGGSQYAWNTGSTATSINVSPAVATDYSVTATDANGCTGSAAVQVSIGQQTTASVQAAICSGDVYLFDGQNLSQPGTYTATFQGANGCDSVVTLQLAVNQPGTASAQGSFCTGGTYDFLGQTLSAAGTYTATFTAANGCDSIVTLELTELLPSAGTEQAAVCAGENYAFNGQTYAAAGTYAVALTAANGCDSVATLVLTIDPLPSPAISLNGQTLETGSYTAYAWYVGGVLVPGANAQTYVPGQNGVYTVVVTDANGCSGTSSPGFDVTFLGTLPVLADQPRVYPNPARETVRIENLPIGSMVQLFDLLGRPVPFPVAAVPGGYDGSVAHLSKGLYWLVVDTGAGRQTIRLTVAGE